ncbi:hypothetical protein D3C72_1987340 [compost metagenome]
MHACRSAQAGHRHGTVKRQRIEHRKTAVDGSLQAGVVRSQLGGYAQRSHFRQARWVAVHHQNVIVAGLLQQQRHGKTNVTRAQDGDGAAGGNVGGGGNGGHGGTPVGARGAGPRAG